MQTHCGEMYTICNKETTGGDYRNIAIDYNTDNV